MSKVKLMHDLKAERPDLAPPLPAILMVLPVMFYLSGVAALGLGVLFTVKTRQAQADEQTELDSEQNVRRMIVSLREEQRVIDEANNKGKEVEAWMDTTQPLMDVVSSVINSVKTGNTLSSLRLARTAENPEHIEMRLEINNGGTIQKEETVMALVREGMQSFKDDLIVSDKNNRLGDVIYTATLVKNKVNEE